MPELPEVETIRTGLENALKGTTIRKATLRRDGLRAPFPKDMANKLAGKKILAIRRRAKYLLFDLSGDDVLISHLGMTGRFSVMEKAPKAFAKHDHVVFELSDGRFVIYNDTRRFGLMTIAKKSDIATHELFAELGPEPLEKDFSTSYLQHELSRRSIAVKVALMDQKVVVGVGNIYASEALFMVGVDPTKPAKKAADKAKDMIPAIIKVLRESIASGGSTLRDFAHVSGDEGNFQHKFNVYGRKGKPCFQCGTPILSIRLSGRSTFYCPNCQK